MPTRTRGHIALVAVMLLGAVAAAITENTATVILLCFLIWRVEDR
jgi:Na+/H+ antiporter NhaD/arsenite permease-like protein